MFQLWTVKLNMCWHFQLIALKMSWPYLCCGQIRHLQCTQFLSQQHTALSHVKWNFKEEKNSFLPGVSSSAFPDSRGMQRASYLVGRDEVIFLCSCVKGHLSAYMPGQNVTTLSQRRSKSHLWALLYIGLISNTTFPSLQLFPLTAKGQIKFSLCCHTQSVFIL